MYLFFFCTDHLPFPAINLFPTCYRYRKPALCVHMYIYIYIFMYKASNPGRKFYILSAIDLTIAIMLYLWRKDRNTNTMSWIWNKVQSFFFSWSLFSCIFFFPSESGLTCIYWAPWLEKLSAVIYQETKLSFELRCSFLYRNWTMYDCTDLPSPSFSVR